MDPVMWMVLGALGWTVLAVGFGVLLGRGIRAADRAEEPTNWVVPPTWEEGDNGLRPPGR